MFTGLKNDNLIFNYKATEDKRAIVDKLYLLASPLVKYSKITTGVKPYQIGKGIPLQTKHIVEHKPYTTFQVIAKDITWKKLIRGTQVNRYALKWEGEYIKYGKWLAEPRNENIFSNSKLFVRRTDDTIMTVFDDSGMVGINSIHTIHATSILEEKVIMCLLNSRLLNWVFQFQNFHMVGKPLAEIKVVFLERLPIIVPTNKEFFIEMAELMLSKNKLLSEKLKQFIQLIFSKFPSLTLSAKLEKWYILSFSDFAKELNKQKIKLSLQEESEWLQYFDQEKQKAIALKTEIDIADKEIDKMVYNLYGITEEEIKIIEDNI